MEFNIQPYHDDFEQNAKDNNYLKILFKPGFSVQARELTQIQSILQNQIKSFGDHIFQDGSPVIGGNLALDNSVTYVKLDETYNNEDVELDLFVGQVILRDSDSLVQAKVLASYFPSGGTPTLLIKYISGASFDDGDVFKVAGTTTRAKLINSSASGRGTIASINDGIFYVDGYFVTVTPQTAVVGAYTQNANVKIGLEVSDEVVDYAIDSTLLDPAQDSFNYQAPGADRYQFALTLSTRPLDTAVDESKFFELMRLENGAITKQVKYPIYSEIEKTLARRTFDESGDYTVVPFRASVSEAANANNYIINLEPGKAYVKGFEFETIGTFRLEVEKPRSVTDERSLVDIDFDTSFGNYLKFKNLTGSNASSFINTDSLDTVDLHCVTVNSVNVGLVGGATANNFGYSNTKIGTARIRAVERDIPSQDGSPTNDSNGVFDVYFTDIQIAPKVFKLETNGTDSTVTLPEHASRIANAYQNTTITVLPIQLTVIGATNKANVFQNSVRVNANSSGVFTGNVSVGDTIRVADETRQVVYVDSSGDFLTVNTAFTKTVIGTGTAAPLAVFKQTDYSSNVTGQTRKITSYSTGRVATLDRGFDESAVPISGTVVQLNFGIQDLNSFIKANTTAIAASSGVGANAHANIAVQSLLVDGSTEMFDGSDKRLIFPLPKNVVQRNSLNNVDYNHLKYLSVTGAAGIFTIPMAAFESVPWSLTNSNIEDNLLAVVRESSSGSYANGSVIKLTTTEVAVTPGLGGSVVITLPAGVSTIDTYTIVKINDAEDLKREKTLRSNTSLSVTSFNFPTSSGVGADYTVNVPNVGNVAKINVTNGLVFITDPVMTNIYPGDSINLYVPDVIKVRAILKGNTASDADINNYEDITDHFVVDYGQGDEIYDHCKLILKQGFPTPNAKMTVHLDFYSHTPALNKSYFSVDSYEASIYEAGQIPVFFSERTGVYYLRDCLDFRATRTIGVATGALETPLIPEPNGSTELSFDYYLPRIDKLVLTKNKEFRIIKGVSSPAPIPPDDADDAMTLYTIYLPAFVATVDDIRLRYNENRRYTMKDISSIDKRVESLEFYTSLNNIEGLAMGDSTKYEDGTDKLKFGVIGEGFKNFNIADYKDPDFNCSMEEGEMGPYIINAPVGMKVVSTTNVQENGRTLSLSYTEEPMVSQPVTSNKLVSVQPFLFAQFIGDITMSPEMDFWVSEELKPDVLRAPEIDSRVREILNAERITDRIVELEKKATVPTPVNNAAGVISTTPGVDPPGTTATVPVQIPAPIPVVTTIPITPIKPAPSGIFDQLRNLFPVAPKTPPAPIPPAPTAVYTAPIRLSGGGGGCVVLESYIPQVVGQVWNDAEVKQAYMLQPGFDIVLADEITLATRVGEVKDVAVELQPCVRVTTIGGTSLVCSTTAPLPTLNGVLKAPKVLGEKVAVFKDNLMYWETVASVEEVGVKFVKVIDAYNNSFWAGEQEGAYILHHNMAFSSGRTTVNKV